MGRYRVSEVLIIPNGFQRQYTTCFVSAVADSGVDVLMPTSDIYDSTELSKSVRLIPVIRCHDERRSRGRKAIGVIRYYGSLVRFVLKSRVRTIHFLWHRFPVLDGLVITGLFRLLDRRVLLTVHDALPHHRQDSAIQGALHKGIYSLASGLAVHSPSVAEFLTTRLGVPGKKIVLIKHGHYEVGDNPRLTKESARNALGLDPSKPYLLFFGYIRPYKGLDTALDALHLVRQSIDASLMIEGEVSTEYRATLNSKYRVESRRGVLCRFGHVPDGRVPLLFQAADAVLLPYREGSQSGVLFMSWTWGRPVVVSSIGNFPLEVISGKNGLVFQVGDANDLAATILEGYSNGLFTDERASNWIWDRVRQDYSWEETARHVAHWYGDDEIEEDM